MSIMCYEIIPNHTKSPCRYRLAGAWVLAVGFYFFCMLKASCPG